MSTYKTKQRKAHQKVKMAVEQGELIRPDICELCGAQPNDIVANGDSIQALVAHHWNSYDHPLDVWWVCRRCNSILSGPKYHSGKINKKQAKSVIASYLDGLDNRKPNQIAKELGERIKKARLRTKFTQDEVAKRLGIGRAAYSNIENGHSLVSIAHLINLALIFHTSIDWLIDTPFREKGTELINLFLHLTNEEQKHVMIFVRALLKSH